MVQLISIKLVQNLVALNKPNVFPHISVAGNFHFSSFWAPFDLAKFTHLCCIQSNYKARSMTRPELSEGGTVEGCEHWCSSLMLFLLFIFSTYQRIVLPILHYIFDIYNFYEANYPIKWDDKLLSISAYFWRWIVKHNLTLYVGISLCCLIISFKN